jgi:hypothetical protein
MYTICSHLSTQFKVQLCRKIINSNCKSLHCYYKGTDKQ